MGWGAHAADVLFPSNRRKHPSAHFQGTGWHCVALRRGTRRSELDPKAFKTFAPRAFTLIELLVVISTIALLAAVLLSALSRVREKANGIQCLNNIRQITVAWTLYAEDHGGRLPLNLDSIDDIGVPINWVAGTMHRASDATNMVLLTDPQLSLLGAYIRVAKAFKCPSDETDFVRSFAMNCRMSPFRPLGAPSWVGGFGTNYHSFYSLHEIANPSNVLVLADERSDSINDAYFAIDMSNTGTPEGNGSPRPFYIIDYPASYHDGSGTISFADGHVEIHKWLEPTTKPPLGKARARVHTSPTDRDVRWLQERSTYPK
jgi:prepilin-type processing-associated H-X9-DG protein/prepilin-type N-terminal cleavage/methylation domain-containing protein